MLLLLARVLQVTLDKASKKFSCAICCQKQSFKKIHAISNSAKDCRKVVQELNELRGARDRQLGSEDTVAALQNAAAAAAAAAGSCPASDAAQQALAWEDFAEPDDSAGIDEDDSWLAGIAEFVTTLPDACAARGRGGKRRAKTAAAAAGDDDDDAPYKQLRYGQGRGKQQHQQQQQQQAYQGVAAGGTGGSSWGAGRPLAQMQRVPPQQPHQQQSRQVPLQQQQQRWPGQQPQQQQQQQAAPAYQQQSSWPPKQQQQQGNSQWGRQATPAHVAPAELTNNTSSTDGSGAAWPQSRRTCPQQGSGAAAGTAQQLHVQHPLETQHPQQQQQQPWLKPPLGSTAPVKQQQGGVGTYSRAQQQQQPRQQLPSKPPAAAAGGAWGAFVDEDGPGACSSDEEQCLVDAQGVCCLGFTGPEAYEERGLPSTAAAAAGNGGVSTAAARWC
jgi:hypothetical protein